MTHGAYIRISAAVFVWEDGGLVMDGGQDDLSEGHVGQRRLAGGNLVQCDAKTPDVCRKIIPANPRAQGQSCTQVTSTMLQAGSGVCSMYVHRSSCFSALPSRGPQNHGVAPVQSEEVGSR